MAEQFNLHVMNAVLGAVAY